MHCRDFKIYQIQPGDKNFITRQLLFIVYFFLVDDNKV